MIWHAWNILEWFGSVAWAPLVEPEQGLGVFQILVTVANYSCPECFGISYLMEVTSFVFCPGAILKLTDSTVNMCFLKKMNWFIWKAGAMLGSWGHLSLPTTGTMVCRKQPTSVSLVALRLSTPGVSLRSFAIMGCGFSVFGSAVLRARVVSLGNWEGNWGLSWTLYIWPWFWHG